ncbi:MAG TPA: penicillin-binding protein 2, partial [Gammaproteobacteria bacterium]|nr:penicillin-binding protein 2 [Gammaproteobacteria bacterium]
MIPALKNHHFESRLFRFRVLLAAGFVLLMVGVLTLRMVNLQIFQHEHYSTLSDDNRVHTISIAPQRGRIYDRNGVLLANNHTTFRLEITPMQVEDMDETLERLSKIISFSEEDLERFQRERKRSRRFSAVPLRFSLNPEEVARFEVN